jgi:cobyric acid synthase
MHRSGQLGAVTIDVLITSGGTIDAWDAAIREALKGRRTARQDLKILRAEIIEEKIKRTSANKYRWATKRGRTGEITAARAA